MLEEINIVVAEDLTFKSLLLLLRKSSLYITNNTGTLHMAHFSGASSLAYLQRQANDWAYKSENENYVYAENINEIKVEDVFNEACRMIDFHIPSTGTN